MIIVAGAGRTGTTAVARTLQERLGVSMGGPGRIHWTNPTGDYEDEQIRAVNRRRYRREVTDAEWVCAFLDAVSDRAEPWGFKDPVSGYWLGAQLDLLPDARVIWAQRDRDDTIASWMRLYKRTRAQAATEIDARLAAIEQHLIGRDHLAVDMTEHRDEGALADELAAWLRSKGQPGL